MTDDLKAAPIVFDEALFRAYHGLKPYTIANAPTAQEYGVGQLWIDGQQYWSDGVKIAPKGIIQNAAYNTDGTISSAEIDGVTYTFTYSSGKISTVQWGGFTKTYTWSGDNLISVVMS